MNDEPDLRQAVSAAAEAGQLTAMGYRRTSNRHSMLSRIDREDWQAVIAKHLNLPPERAQSAACNADYYRRALSKDTITVDQAVAKIVPTSCGDRTGYIPKATP